MVQSPHLCCWSHPLVIQPGDQQANCAQSLRKGMSVINGKGPDTIKDVCLFHCEAHIGLRKTPKKINAKQLVWICADLYSTKVQTYFSLSWVLVCFIYNLMLKFMKEVHGRGRTHNLVISFLKAAATRSRKELRPPPSVWLPSIKRNMIEILFTLSLFSVNQLYSWGACCISHKFLSKSLTANHIL